MPESYGLSDEEQQRIRQEYEEARRIRATEEMSLERLRQEYDAQGEELHRRSTLGQWQSDSGGSLGSLGVTPDQLNQMVRLAESEVGSLTAVQENINQVYSTIQDSIVLGTGVARVNLDPDPLVPEDRVIITSTPYTINLPTPDGSSQVITTRAGTSAGTVRFQTVNPYMSDLSVGVSDGSLQSYATITTSDNNSWQYYGAQFAKDNAKYTMKKEKEKLSLINFAVLNLKMFSDNMSGGVYGLFEPSTNKLYIAHSSCIVEGVLRHLKRIQSGLDADFSSIKKVDVYVFNRNDDYTGRLIHLNYYIELAKNAGYKLLNKTDGLILKPYVKVTKMKPCLYLRNRAGDMFLVGVFNHMDQLNAFKNKHYKNDIVTEIHYHDQELIAIWEK